MDATETEAQPEKKARRKVMPMTREERAEHYAAQHTAFGGTPAQKRRLKHKENRAIAAQVRVAEEKVARLRGAAKKSAQKTLDKLREMFK